MGQNIPEKGSKGHRLSHFTALPAGPRGYDGFKEIGAKSYFWSSDRFYLSRVNYLKITYIVSEQSTPVSGGLSMADGLSVRCVKDN